MRVPVPQLRNASKFGAWDLCNNKPCPEFQRALFEHNNHEAPKFPKAFYLVNAAAILEIVFYRSAHHPFPSNPMRNSPLKKRLLTSATGASGALEAEISRIIGNARFNHHVCVMARNSHGMAEFGALFHLIQNLAKPLLEKYLDLIDEVRKTHRFCLRCSLKFTAFCCLFCGNQLPIRRALYDREYAALLALWGPGRDFMQEVRHAIRMAKPAADAATLPSARPVPFHLRVFPTEIRLFRGDLER